VLGEMLELGPQGADLHRGLADAIIGNAIDLVFCAGPLFQGLWEALPSERRGGYAGTAAELEADVVRVLQAGDVVMIKGSLGSKMGPIVKALIRQYSLQEGRTAAVQG
jgi:UDP-N-acetylmuramoyl-tripeptide--D-alanyl-D-alanine ligase